MSQFLEEVQQQVGLGNEDQAEKLAEAVLGTLRSSLTPEEASHVEAQLPEYVADLWRGNFFERIAHKVQGAESWGYDGFVTTVAEDGWSREQAEGATRAVFHLLKAQIDEGEQRHVAAQLPSDLESVWLNS